LKGEEKEYRTKKERISGTSVFPDFFGKTKKFCPELQVVVKKTEMELAEPDLKKVTLPKLNGMSGGLLIKLVRKHLI
jgi:hypothetical protein